MILFQEIGKLKVEWNDLIDSLLPKGKEICRNISSFDKVVVN